MHNSAGYVYVHTDTNAQKGQKHCIHWSWWLLRELPDMGAGNLTQALLRA